MELRPLTLFPNPTTKSTGIKELYSILFQLPNSREEKEERKFLVFSESLKKKINNCGEEKKRGLFLEMPLKPSVAVETPSIIESGSPIFHFLLIHFQNSMNL